jgi:hypothetical protein
MAGCARTPERGPKRGVAAVAAAWRFESSRILRDTDDVKAGDTLLFRSDDRDAAMIDRLRVEPV